MTVYNSISKWIIKFFNIANNLFFKTVSDIFENFWNFILLFFIFISLVIFFTISNEWINAHVPTIYDIVFSMICLRLAIYCFWVGVSIGFVKIVFNYIDKKKIVIFDIFKYFYLVPSVLSFNILVYIMWMFPIGYILYKFSYNIAQYGTNLSLYLQDIQDKLIHMFDNEISKNLLSAYFNETDMIIFSILFIVYFSFIIKYWSTLLFIIDQGVDIKQGLKLTTNSHQKISYNIIFIVWSSCIIYFVAQLSIILGLESSLFFLFIIGSIILGIVIFWLNYFRLLSRSN